MTSESLRSRYLRLPTEHSPISNKILSDPKFYPFFKDAKAAIDGTHIPAHPPSWARAACRDRSGEVSQNVLSACTFDMQFCYVLAGWEGSISDSLLFEKARAAGLHIPPGSYYLGDAGFPSCDWLLVPYRGVRYHLREWLAAKER